MSLTVTRARVKEHAGITVADYDTSLDHLLSELVPAIEAAIRSEVLASGDAGIAATLNWAALEICTGEAVALQYRQTGGVAIAPDAYALLSFFRGDARDPSGLVKAGYLRLCPYLAEGGAVGHPVGVISALKDSQESSI